ncbi:DUF461 domain-containing protein [Streptomyces sp. NBC_01476]|uniref:DUF461 domain-containing protein n=1 Tax=Streptomyces sp. NBC_01476 TaxID=2903881 RepID=UPI002E331D16|nr:DUF461 domain-containing protein [Streptomyces sp. NBC_01476]
MVRSFRRGAFAAVLALSLAPLAACAAGTDATSLKVEPDSAYASAGVIKVQNAFVLTQADGPATVSARLFNNGSSPQTLQSVQLAGALNARLSGANGGKDVTVPAHGTVLLGGKGNPAAVIDSGQESLRDGDVQTAVFRFSGSGPVSLPINITPSAGYFQPYGPSSLPTTATPSPSDTATPTTTPDSTATPTDTATPTGTATPTA